MIKKLTITDGPSFKYFYLGLILSGISILISCYSSVYYLGFILLPFGIFLFLSIRGTVIDFERKKVKNYWNIVFVKIGKWESLDAFTRVELLLNSQSQTMNYRSVSNTIRVRSYYLILTNERKESIELKEFTDYNKAKKMLVDIGKALKIQTVNRKELLENQPITRK